MKRPFEIAEPAQQHPVSEIDSVSLGQASFLGGVS